MVAVNVEKCMVEMVGNVIKWHKGNWTYNIICVGGVVAKTP